MLIFLLAKWGVNVIYEEGFLYPDNIRYTIATLQMESINVDEFSELIAPEAGNTETTLIYMGRKTCPVCVDLMPEIKSILAENETLADGTKTQQYYFDSGKYKSERTKELRDSIGADYVPSIIVVQNETVNVYDADSIGTGEFGKQLSRMLNI